MAIHCAQCGLALPPANVHRCARCGLPYCRKHVRHHRCEPASRSDLAKWATSFEKGADEEKGELPLGPTYRPVSGAQLFSPELGSAAIVWFLGLGGIIAGSLGFLPAYADAISIGGAVLGVVASVILARTFAQMHVLSRPRAFAIFLVFAAVPILTLLSFAYL